MGEKGQELRDAIFMVIYVGIHQFRDTREWFFFQSFLHGLRKCEK